MDRLLDHIPASHRHESKGFTLLEVIVALAVLAICLTVVYRMQHVTVTMSVKSRFLTMAPQLAQAKLTEIERQSFEQIVGDSGDFGEDFPNYTWKVSVEEIDSELIPDRNYHLVRINIDIAKDDTNSYQLRTYRYYVDAE